MLSHFNYLAAAGAYYLSQDSDQTKFDSSKHTLVKLYDILEDIYLEYACAYIFYYNMILNMKEKKEFSNEKLENLKASVESYTNSRDEIVAKKHGITALFLEIWIEKFKGDK